MVRSDIGASGVMFTIDTESGFRTWYSSPHPMALARRWCRGGEPDEFYVPQADAGAGQAGGDSPQSGLQAHQDGVLDKKVAGRSTATVDVPEAERTKFALNDEDVLELARYAVIIEQHYGRPMDIEWGKSGDDGKLYILQARPETVMSQSAGTVMEKYRLKQYGKSLTHGRAIGQKIGAGPVRVIQSPSEMNRVQAGDILVTDMTDPNWEPVMKRASAIVTNRGGRTCHAAIIARARYPGARRLRQCNRGAR